MLLFFVRLHENGNKFLSDNWTHLHSPSLFCQAFIVTEPRQKGGSRRKQFIHFRLCRTKVSFFNRCPTFRMLCKFTRNAACDIPCKKSLIVFYSDDFWPYGAWPSIMPMLCRGYFNFKGIALFNNPLKFTMRSLCVQRGQKHVENLGMVVGSTLLSFE